MSKANDMGIYHRLKGEAKQKYPKPFLAKSLRDCVHSCLENLRLNILTRWEIMDFAKVIQARQSVRAFQSRRIEEEKLRSILEAANTAPSAGNLQAYEIFLVTGQKQRDVLARAAWMQEFIATAPVALIFCTHSALAEGKYGKRGIQLYSLQDATIACTYAMLTATDLGLASVWIGAFNDEAVKKVIDAPAGVYPVAILPIGYAAETPERTSRRLLENVVHEVH
jgi:nitroreductase